MIILIIVLILVFGLGGNFYGEGQYRNGGFGIGGLLIIFLLIWLFLGHRL